MSLTVGSLFAGIGGFDLAAERVGFEVKWQVEIDDYCTKVLEKHWPHVRRYRDIRDVDWSAVERVDVLCGGFPCQPVSMAGRQLAQSDPRWLWPEIARAVRVLRPRRVLVENVPGLLVYGMGDVLGDLACLGYDAEWQSIPAAAVGAPHVRWRIWILAYPENDGIGRREQQQKGCEGPRQMAYANGSGLEGLHEAGGRVYLQSAPRTLRRDWLPEPELDRVAYGIPNRTHRLRGLGNAIVPQVAEWIFSRIKEAEGLT